MTLDSKMLEKVLFRNLDPYTSPVDLFLKFRGVDYELCANPESSELTSDIDPSSIDQEDQDDIIEVNVSNISHNDVVSIRLQVPTEVGCGDFI
jgi:hypothetical protein